MIVRKSEHTTYTDVFLFAASPKFGCTPSGGDARGVLDNNSGIGSVNIENMIDLCFDMHTARSPDAGCKESELELFFLLRSRR